MSEEEVQDMLLSVEIDKRGEIDYNGKNKSYILIVKLVMAAFIVNLVRMRLNFNLIFRKCASLANIIIAI